MADEATKVITAEDILGLGSADLVIREMAVPEWGANAVVYLREMPADVGLPILLRINDAATEGVARPYAILAGSLCDAQGQPLFKSEEEARQALKGRGTKVIARLAKQAQILQGWLNEDERKNV